MSSYGNVHRRFVQSFVHNPCQTEEDVTKTYRICCEEQGEPSDSDDNLEEVIDLINRTLRKHTTLEIKPILCELTGIKYYVAANLSNMSWAKITTPFTKNEQLLFKKILDEIMKSDDGCASSIACLNDTGSNITKGDATKCIVRFVAEGWFTEKEGRLYMGVRSAAELEPLILDAYDGETSQCPLCRKLVYWGHRCGSCSEVGHMHCLKKFFASSGAKVGCPSCHADWTDWESDEEN